MGGPDFAGFLKTTTFKNIGSTRLQWPRSTPTDVHLNGVTNIIKTVTSKQTKYYQLAFHRWGLGREAQCTAEQYQLGQCNPQNSSKHSTSL